MSWKGQKALSDVFLGPTLIVDDDFASSKLEGALARIVSQIQEAQVPLFTWDELPASQVAAGLEGFQLLIVDWEFNFPAEEDIDVGLDAPSLLRESSEEDVLDFLQAALEHTVAPIFVVSSAAPDEIDAALDARFVEKRLRDRVHVFSKSELRTDVYGHLAEWLSNRPSLAAIHLYRRAVRQAERSTFSDLAQSEGEWLPALIKAYRVDGVDLAASIKEVVERNISNRVSLDAMDISWTSEDDADVSAQVVRSVLHRAAFIPSSSLPGRELGSGDVFRRVGNDDELKILLTPDCDLVRQARVRGLYVVGRRAQSDKLSKNLVSELRKNPSKLALLDANADVFDFRIDSLSSVALRPLAKTPWRGHERVGRLLNPHLTHFQQSIFGHLSRVGLPRLPDNFFDSTGS